MKISIFTELQQPRPWGPRTEYENYWQNLELIDLAEEYGFHTVWLAEHHLLPEWSHSSAPEVYFGAVSQRTKRIRLGHGVVLLPKNFNHIIRVAERTAALDILSNGRVEVGTGRSVTKEELLGFEVDPEESLPQWDEALRILPRLWTEEVVSHQGRYYNMPERTVVPKPIQKPHPPLWVAGTSPATFIRAAERGIGMKYPTGTQGLEAIKPLIKQYRETIKTCKPVGHFVNNKVAINIHAYLDESNKKALEDIKPYDAWVHMWGQRIFGGWTDPNSKGYGYYAELTKQREVERHATTPEDRIKRGCVIVGDPKAVIEQLERFQEAGVDELETWYNFGGVPHEQAKRALKLMGEKVMPHLHSSSAKETVAS